VERRPDGEHSVDAEADGLEIVRGVPDWLRVAAD